MCRDCHSNACFGADTPAGVVNIEGGGSALTNNTFRSNVASQSGGAIFYTHTCIDEHIPGKQCASQVFRHICSPDKTALSASAC